MFFHKRANSSFFLEKKISKTLQEQQKKLKQLNFF